MLILAFLSVVRRMILRCPNDLRSLYESVIVCTFTIYLENRKTEIRRHVVFDRTIAARFIMIICGQKTYGDRRERAQSEIIGTPRGHRTGSVLFSIKDDFHTISMRSDSKHRRKPEQEIFELLTHVYVIAHDHLRCLES